MEKKKQEFQDKINLKKEKNKNEKQRAAKQLEN